MDSAIFDSIRAQLAGVAPDAAPAHGTLVLPIEPYALVEVVERLKGTFGFDMGDAAGFATVGIIAKYRDEFEYYINNGRSKCGGVLEVDAPQQEPAHA